MAKAATQNAGFSQGSGKTMVSLKGVKEDAGFEAIPKGMYNCEIDEVEAKLSNNGGNPMWSLRLKVVDEGDYLGRILFTHIVFTDKMAGRNVKLFNRLGLSEINELDEFDYEDDNLYTKLLDRPCRARVDIQKYEGRNTNRVKDILGPSDSEGAFLPGDEENS